MGLVPNDRSFKVVSESHQFFLLILTRSKVITTLLIKISEKNLWDSETTSKDLSFGTNPIFVALTV